jgi:hypothetical protein
MASQSVNTQTDQATKTYPNGDKYTGQWSQGERCGYGQQIYANPVQIDYGGTYNQTHQSIYTGEWKHDNYNGMGILIKYETYYATKYEGLFHTTPGQYLKGHGRFVHGSISFLNVPEVRMVGELSSHSGEMYFDGKLKWLDGSVFIGKLKYSQILYALRSYIHFKEMSYEWLFECTGKYIYPNGDIYEGDFKHRKRQGQGSMRYSYGIVETGRWAEDKIRGKIHRRFIWKVYINQVIKQLNK